MTPQAPSTVPDHTSPLKIDRSALGGAGSLTIRSTSGIPASERLDFWRQSVLQRMDPTRVANGGQGFSGRMTHVVGKVCDFVVHASDPIHTKRDLARLKRDACDDLIISLVGNSGSARLRHAGEWHLRSGDLCIADFSRPIAHERSRHRDVTLIFRRRAIEEAVKGDPGILAGRLLPRRGISALLRSHMRGLAEEVEQLSQSGRAVALAAAGEMAILALQAEFTRAADEEIFPAGLLAAALILIRRECWNPDLDPGAVARGVGCSRATLYRVFAARGESVAKMIWSTRLEGAHRMLTAADHRHLRIDEIGFRNGFADMPTFNRMFKRRYCAAPREVRVCPT